jgi:hypothetical protein
VQRLQPTGWDQCVVVNSAGVVLGLLRGEALQAAPEAPVALAMESGPTTIRPNRSPRDIQEYMRQHGAASVVVTTPAGQLIGLVERQSIEQCLAPAAQPHQGRDRRQHGTPSVAIGYKLSCEEHSPRALVDYARQAEEAGFTFAMLSDHYGFPIVLAKFWGLRNDSAPSSLRSHSQQTLFQAYRAGPARRASAT